MKIIIQNNSRALRNGQPNPKVPPSQWWGELYLLLKEHEIVVLPDILTWERMKEHLDWCNTWISVDSYWQHFAWYYGKKGIVIWGQSDPLIFGHKENINLLKDKASLRTHQFASWEETSYNEDVFIEPKLIKEKLDMGI